MRSVIAIALCIFAAASVNVTFAANDTNLGNNGTGTLEGINNSPSDIFRTNRVRTDGACKLLNGKMECSNTSCRLLNNGRMDCDNQVCRRISGRVECVDKTPSTPETFYNNNGTTTPSTPNPDSGTMGR